MPRFTSLLSLHLPQAFPVNLPLSLHLTFPTRRLIIMEAIILEDRIMQKTTSYLLSFTRFCPVLFSILLYIIAFYTFQWLGVILIGSVLNLYPPFMTYLNDRFRSLYTARDEADKCLDLLRDETLKDPIKANYSCTYRSCTAVLRFSHEASVDHTAAERVIDGLAETVASPFFMGIAHMSSGGVNAYHVNASLYCTNSWGGVARYIAKTPNRDTILHGKYRCLPSFSSFPYH